MSDTLAAAIAEIYTAIKLDDTAGPSGLGPVSIQSFDHEPDKDEITKGPLFCATVSGARWAPPEFTIPWHLLVGQLDPDPENIAKPTVADSQALFVQLIDEISKKLDAASYRWTYDTGETQGGSYVCTWSITGETDADST